MRLFRRDHENHVSGLSLIVGLGNPGRQYEKTRHNAGAMAVEFLAERHDVRLRSSKQLADVGRATIEGLSVLLARPLTFMNESGDAVGRLVRYYDVPPQRLLVIYDEMDLPFGTLRLRPEGSSAGNRGVESIIQALRTDEFPRLRIGVGRPEHGAISHVLGNFPEEQRRQLPVLLDIAGQAAVAALRDGVETTMNRYNRDWSQELIPNINPQDAK